MATQIAPYVYAVSTIMKHKSCKITHCDAVRKDCRNGCVELWKPIPGTHGAYAVSNFGEIKRAKPSKARNTWVGRKRSMYKTHEGYVFSTVNDSYVRLHSLVARVFIGPRPPGAHVNHIDFDRAHNHVCNLEYVTPKENSQYTLRNGRRSSTVGERNPNAKLTLQAVKRIKKLLRSGRTVQFVYSMFAKYGIAPSAIQDIALGRSWVKV